MLPFVMAENETMLQFPMAKFLLSQLLGVSGEWPSGLNSFRQVTEVKVGRVR